MTKSQMKYSSLALLILAAVVLIFGSYLGISPINFSLISFPSAIIFFYVAAVSIIVYRLLQYYYFKTVVLSKSYNWVSLSMILFVILQLIHRSTNLLLGFPEYITLSVLFILLGAGSFLKFVRKDSTKQDKSIGT